MLPIVLLSKSMAKIIDYQVMAFSAPVALGGVIIALLVYLIFLLIPDIDNRITYMEKDLSAVLVQSERFKKSTRVFARDNSCASCHLDPDHLLHNLQTTYPSFSDIKAFMRVGHKRYSSASNPSDEELMAVYRTLK